jgi:hypothetical protein
MITIRVEKGYVWQMSVVKPKAFPLRARSKQNFISSTANVIFFFPSQIIIIIQNTKSWMFGYGGNSELQ